MIKQTQKKPMLYSAGFFAVKMGFGLLALAGIAVVLIAGQESFRQSVITANYRVVSESSNLKVRNVQANTAQDLNNIFEVEGYEWPPSLQQTVPPLILQKLPDDFATMRDHRKRQNQ